MKKYLVILVLGLLVISSPANSGNIGSGELKLHPSAVNAFIEYVQIRDKPRIFLVPIDGSSASWWYCPAGTQCVAGGATQEIKKCERYHKKDCAVFAKRRKIKWRNGINEEIKFSFKRSMSDAEIKAKLTELGFMSESSSASTFDSSNPDVVEKLKSLKKLYDDGALTKEDFEKAKKKVLNN